MKKLIITGISAVALVAIAGTSAVAIQAATQDNELMCFYDPKTGDYKDPDTGAWSAYGSWNEALGCASRGLLPQNVADRIGVWGSKKDQAIGKLASKTNKRVAAENAAKAKLESQK